MRPFTTKDLTDFQVIHQLADSLMLFLLRFKPSAVKEGEPTDSITYYRTDSAAVTLRFEDRIPKVKLILETSDNQFEVHDITHANKWEIQAYCGSRYIDVFKWLMKEWLSVDSTLSALSSYPLRNNDGYKGLRHHYLSIIQFQLERNRFYLILRKAMNRRDFLFDSFFLAEGVKFTFSFAIEIFRSPLLNTLEIVVSYEHATEGPNEDIIFTPKDRLFSIPRLSKKRWMEPFGEALSGEHALIALQRAFDIGEEWHWLLQGESPSQMTMLLIVLCNPLFNVKA